MNEKEKFMMSFILEGENRGNLLVSSIKGSG